MHDVVPATRRTANLMRADSMPGVGVTAHGIILASWVCVLRVDGQRHSGIRITHADGRAARQRERTRTPNATAAGICASSFVLGSVAGLLLYFIAVPHQKQ